MKPIKNSLRFKAKVARDLFAYYRHAEYPMSWSEAAWYGFHGAFVEGWPRGGRK